MRRFVLAAWVLAWATVSIRAQGTFEVTGTPIPSELLQQNYGTVSKGIVGYDLSICNITAFKQSIVSSKIYQALAQANTPLQPIGKQIMLAAILRNQGHSKSVVLSVALNSLNGVLSILAGSKYKVPTGLLAGATLVSLSGQQIMSGLKPVLPADLVEKYESQVLEPALVLDSGSCVERTMFTIPAGGATAKTRVKPESLSFHIE
jgi:hypothetical protein